MTATALITPIKYKIDVRKKFLEKTLGSLSIVTKLPNKPGDQENISGVVKNLQESFKGVFVHNQELYKNQIDLLAESLQLLLRIRGELKAWVDVDKFVKQYNITDGQLVRMVKNAKDPDGGGIFRFFGGEDFKNLIKLLGTQELLTQDYRLFHKTITGSSSTDNIISKLNNYKKVLEDKITAINTYHLYHNCPKKLEPTIIVKNNEFYNFSLILSKYFTQDVCNIILEYFIDNSIISNYHKKQLYYTSIAIQWLNSIQSLRENSLKDTHSRVYINANSVIELPDEKEISNGKPRSKLKNERYDYTGLTKKQQIQAKEYLDHLKERDLIGKLSLLKQTQEILSFFEQIFIKGNVQHLQKIPQLLDLIELDLHSSNFLKIINLREKSNLEFIQKTIHPIIYLIRFFSYENMQDLNTKDELVQKEIQKIEEYLTSQTGPMLKTLVESAIYDEYKLLNNFSYLIKHGISKKLSAFSLLDLLIRLTEYGKLHTQNLLSSDGLDKLVMFKFTTQILFDEEDKFFLLFYLIDSGYANIKMVNELLKIEIDINDWYNGRSLLDSIAYQLTKVGREKDFSLLIPKKYNIDPKKQDQLIDVALHLIHNGADINSDSHKRGFLTTLFSIVPSEQGPYLYKKLLSDQGVISQLDLQEVDLWGRNLAHLFCKDLLEIFYSFPDAQKAKVQVNNILISIISSKNSHLFGTAKDKEGNTSWHYLASAITANYINTKTDSFLEKIKPVLNLSSQNKYGDTPLHTSFTMLGDPAAFYKFVLTDIYSPAQWLKSPRLGLKIQNQEEQTVLDMIINTKNKLAAKVINVYIAVVNYKIDLDDDCTFETICSQVGTYLKSIPQVPADEIERTIYLGERYGSTKYDSSSSSSSLSSSSTSSMSSSFPSSSSFYHVIHVDSEITERGRTDTEYDWHSMPPLIGESEGFTLHG